MRQIINTLTLLISMLILFLNPINAEESSGDLTWYQMFPEAAAEMPDGRPNLRAYAPQMWEAGTGYGSFYLGTFAKNTLNLSWITYTSEPVIGYPLHYGYVSGLNDTIQFRVVFINRTQSYYSIGTQNPEQWFYPVLYDPFVDVFSTPPQADTSAFSYRFEYWSDTQDNIITDKPSSIPNDHTKSYGLVFSIWGVSPGHFRVILKPTSLLPSDVHLSLDGPNNTFRIVNPQHLLDTLNAYCAISISAFRRNDFTLCQSYLNNIFSINPYSVPGWIIKAESLVSQGDTISAIAALDSVIYYLENWLDPMLGFSIESAGNYQIAWYRQNLQFYKFRRWKLKFPIASSLMGFL